MENDSSQATQLFVNPADEEQLLAYYAYEEEVPKSGIKVEATWQRTRWYNGKTVCWYGRRKKVSRGEGASGLAFDQITNLDLNDEEALIPS
jgi:hypothetical protein